MEARIATIRLWGGDWHDRISASSRALEDLLEDLPPARAGDEDTAKTAVDKHNALIAEADAAAEVVRVRALGRRQFRNLRATYPPREGNEGDARGGFDLSREEDYADDLVFGSLIHPEFSSRAAFDEWADTLSEIDFQRIASECFLLNSVGAVDPKSLRASLPTQDGEKNLSSPDDSPFRIGD